MAVDFKTFLSVVPHIINARYPVLVRGRHGIGKSTVVYQLAKERGLPVVERRASQMTEGDLLGLPKVEGIITGFESNHRARPCIKYVVPEGDVEAGKIVKGLRSYSDFSVLPSNR